MRCPLGGSPSGRNAQNSFTLYVQTPLFAGVWVSATLPLPVCSLHTVHPHSELLSSDPLSIMWHWKDSMTRSIWKWPKASLHTLGYRNQQSFFHPCLNSHPSILPFLYTPDVFLPWPSFLLVYTVYSFCLQPRTRARRTLPWPLFVWWKRMGLFYRMDCMTL